MKKILEKLLIPAFFLLFSITMILIEYNQTKIIPSLDQYKSHIEENIRNNIITSKNTLKEEEFFLVYEEDNKIVFVLDKNQRKNQSKTIILEAHFNNNEFSWSCSKNINWVFLRNC